MTRLPRLVIPGWVHHVTQRGNSRQAVFYSDNERHVYLALVAEYFPLHGLTLVGYDLMTNHSHLAVIPDSEDSLALGIGRMHNDYSRWHNVQHGRHGHLWQNRFYSCPVEEDRVQTWTPTVLCIFEGKRRHPTLHGSLMGVHKFVRTIRRQISSPPPVCGTLPHT